MSFVGEIWVIDSKRTKKVQARVEQRVEAGLCLYQHEDGTYCDAQHENRGRCSAHYQRFVSMLRKCRNRTQREKVEAALIKAGVLLARHEICEIKRNDLDARILAEVGE